MTKIQKKSKLKFSYQDVFHMYNTICQYNSIKFRGHLKEFYGSQVNY